jgi:hypothetical protein
MADMRMIDGRRPRLTFIVTSHLTAMAFLPGITAYLARDGWDVTVVCSPSAASPDLSSLVRA